MEEDERQGLLESVTQSTDDSGSISLVTYNVYKRRWYILAVLALLNFSNGMLWMTFSPIADVTAKFYGADSMGVNWLSLVFLVSSVPLGFVATWLLDTLGLRTGIILGAWLNVSGSILRVVSAQDIVYDYRYLILMIGQTLAAVAQPFVMFAPTKLAALWFMDHQRATANMIATIANIIGILVTNFLSPVIVHQADQYQMSFLLAMYTIPAAVVTLMATFGVCSSQPPTPPTASAAEPSEPFLQGLKQIVRSKSYWVLAVSFGGGLAVVTSLSTMLEQMLCSKGYSDYFAGIGGALLFGVGVVGAGLASFFVDKTKKFEEVAKTCYSLGTVSLIAFALASLYSGHPVLIAILLSLVGFFGVSTLPVCLELGVECTYPVAEATSAGFLYISGQIQGIIYILAMQFLARPVSPGSTQSCRTDSDTSGVDPRDFTISNLVIIGVLTLSSLLLVTCFKCEYRRLRAEQQIVAERILNYGSRSYAYS